MFANHLPDASTALDGRSSPPHDDTTEDAIDAIRADSPDDQIEHTPRRTAQIFQCPVGPHVLRDVIKLPCGQCLCKECLPQPYKRDGIEKTWPGTSDRVDGIWCPCCDTEHSTGDCWPDYLSNAAIKKVQALVARLGISALEYGQELVQAFAALDLQTTLPEESGDLSLEEDGRQPTGAIDKMESTLRREMDCAICHSLLYQPWTTPCGHTFCLHCITRSLTISCLCPTCRTAISSQHLVTQMSLPNRFIVRVTTYFWSEDLGRRKEHVRTESPYPDEDESGLDVPLFVCTVSFPRMPTLLHVFEMKYRNMIRRVWDDNNGGKHFGMILPDRYGSPTQVGVHLRIDDLTMLPDGRSVMETTGTSRFRIKRRGEHADGYTIAEVENFDDVSLYEEENREAAEIAEHSNVDPPLPTSFQSITHRDLNRMSTRELMEYAHTSIMEMHGSSPAWLNSRILAIYGNCPDDPGLFPWWLGSIIPLDEGQKVRLLEQITVRERMKICCGWIMEWNAQRRTSW